MHLSPSFTLLQYLRQAIQFVLGRRRLGRGRPCGRLGCQKAVVAEEVVELGVRDSWGRVYRQLRDDQRSRRGGDSNRWKQPTWCAIL